MKPVETDDKRSVFGKLLLEHRRAAGWTQERLAEASGLSVRALRELEHGRARAAQQRSAEVLADALGLTEGDREFFLTVAKQGRRRNPALAAQAAAICALPAPLADLCGRESELAQLSAKVAEGGGVVAIVGQAGVGKTALAVTAADRVRGDFPDGCFAVNLRGMDEEPLSARAALDRLLRALDVAPGQVPVSESERSALLRMLLDGRKVLLLLDNAADEAQVRPLLVTGPGSLTLITCRRTLAGLEGARWLGLEPLSDEGATGLLALIAGADRVRAEPAAARELVELCGYLPLAVRIAGNRLATRPQWSLAQLADRLRDEGTRLRALAAGDLQLRSAFDLSYRAVSAGARRLFRRLATVPGADFGLELACVVSGAAPADVREHLDELVDASLLQTTAAPERHQFHDLIRLFAEERFEAEEDPSARDVVLAHLLGKAAEAARLFYPKAPETGRFGSRDDVARWLDVEGDNWVAAQRVAARKGWHREVSELAVALHWYSDGRSGQRPWWEIFSLGAAAANALGNAADEAKLLNFVGWACNVCLDDAQGAVEAHRRALDIATRIGDRTERTWATIYLGQVLRYAGKDAEAFEYAKRGYESAGELPFWDGQSSARNVYGQSLLAAGRHAEALAVHRALLADAERFAGDTYPGLHRMLKALTLRAIGDVLGGLAEWREAAGYYRTSRWLSWEGGFGSMEAICALREGRAWREAGAFEEARECLTLAVELFPGPGLRARREQALAELALLPG
ncbi:ATP-binding protein [Amycolatopsis regifaucium]|uniref:Transcriptional regulator, XRE family protein n=1 Tax=Amycolatopsis regifaucium TaxID=546365 RepID=A0A154MEV4_9PSEU|nr:helix-turn-helix domain-containing protein [Amycolatopsis regifaucium]KZB82976.1 transcriptional regulator, XRE family protein [Amycolatopsis regifaucium]OKA11353.1 transcriptional regulator, XRE family protein [Amycolatopsis regifaucium]SFH43970.1 Helix-turn-helix domain-containing protein [Amycolatopsis regifaucium]